MPESLSPRRRARSRALAFLILASLCGATPPATTRGQAQTPQHFPAPLVKELKQLQRAALESDYAYRQVAYLSNNIGPRINGSPQAQRAVEYVAGEMRRLGLDVRLQKVTVPHWERGEETAALVRFPGQTPATTQKIVLTALGNSVATPPAGLTAEVVVVESFEELAALGRQKVAGKIVLFNKAFDERMAAQGFGGEAYGQVFFYRFFGANAAAEQGAVAALVRSAGISGNRLPHTGAMRYAPELPKIPAAAVAAEDAELIASLAAQGSVRMHLKLTPVAHPDATSYNVIADLKGAEQPEQVIIVSGHLDSWDLGTGALDDAAGVAMAMQTVQLIKRLGLRPKRTIRFVAWMAEENSGAGGRAYAQEQAKEVANHFAAIESDLGAGHPLGFNARIKPEAQELLGPISNVLESQGAASMRIVGDTEADISPLAEAGVPCFGLWQDSRTYFMYHHTAADTLDKIDRRELAENAAAMAVLAYGLANMTGTLPR